MKRYIRFLLLLCVAVTITACQKTGETKMNSYTSILQEEAKRIMDTETDYVIVDARTQEEFAGGHIKGAIMIPEYEIKNQAESKLPRKDQLILVYCRSGRRSKIASIALAEMGYTNVKEFGGLIDWQYEIER